MTTDATEDEIDTSAESSMFNDALINGDEKINVLVRLVDTRFNSQTRRTNKMRRESRDRDEALRRDLAPVILAAKMFPMLGGFGSFVTLLYLLHSFGVF